MENNYFDTVEKISGRLDKLCKRGIVSRYRAGSGNSGYSLEIEESTGQVIKFNVENNGSGFKAIQAELRRMEKLKG